MNEKKNWKHNEEHNDFRRHLESMKKKNYWNWLYAPPAALNHLC